MTAFLRRLGLAVLGVPAVFFLPLLLARSLEMAGYDEAVRRIGFLFAAIYIAVAVLYLAVDAALRRRNG